MSDPVSDKSLSDLITGGKPPAPQKIKMSALRAEYPMYNDLSDEQFLRGFHKKHYSDLPLSQVLQRIDFDTERQRLQKEMLDEMGWGGQFAAGAGKAVTDIGRTVRRLNPFDSYNQADAQADAELDKPLEETSGGFWGGLAGDVAATAVLPGASLKLAGKALPRAAQAFTRGGEVAGRIAQSVLPRSVQTVGSAVSPFAKQAAAGAAIGAAMNPEDWEQGAKGGAIFGTLGEGAGRILTRAVGGVVGRTSDEAKQLIAQGIDVPAWKATVSPTFQRLGESAKALPLVGKLVKAREQQAVRQWNEMLAREASPPMPVLDDAGRVIRWEQQPVKGAGAGALREAHGNFGKAYDALYQGRTIPVDDAFRSELDRILATQVYTPGNAADVEGAILRAKDTLLEAVEPTVNRLTSGGQQLGKGKISSRITTPVQTIETTQLGHAGINPSAAKKALDDIETAITTAWGEGNKDKAESLKEVRAAITALRDRGLPPEVQSMLGPVNQAYSKYKTLAQAASMTGAQKAEGVVTPSQLLNAISKRTKNKDVLARQTAPGQQQALLAERVLGNELPSVGPGTAEKLMPWLTLGSIGTAGGAAMMGTDLGLLALLGTPWGRNALAGKYGPQQFIANNPELLPFLLRNYGISQSN